MPTITELLDYNMVEYMVLDLSHVKSSDILSIYQYVLDKKEEKVKFVIFPNVMEIFLGKT